MTQRDNDKKIERRSHWNRIEAMNQEKFNLILSAGIGGLVILVASVLVFVVIRYWKTTTKDSVVDVSDVFSDYREMYARGELSRAEFDHIRQGLGKELSGLINKK
ncbi:MAG: hypothetical protein MK103_01970 [Planctomycetes bacterium]|nr:hypothetical protein [Planctomycetota bacterium]